MLQQSVLMGLICLSGAYGTILKCKLCRRIGPWLNPDLDENTLTQDL
jgi:hypothetical protein